MALGVSKTLRIENEIKAHVSILSAFLALSVIVMHLHSELKFALGAIPGILKLVVWHAEDTCCCYSYICLGASNEFCFNGVLGGQNSNLVYWHFA